MEFIFACEFSGKNPSAHIVVFDFDPEYRKDWLTICRNFGILNYKKFAVFTALTNQEELCYG